jgi:hypothetical protein
VFFVGFVVEGVDATVNPLSTHVSDGIRAALSIQVVSTWCGGLMRCRSLASILVFTAILAQDFRPARFSAGSLPLPPPQVVGWSEVILQATVSAAGVVEKVVALRGTEPLTGIVLPAVEQWRFEPAMLDG